MVGHLNSSFTLIRSSSSLFFLCVETCLLYLTKAVLMLLSTPVVFLFSFLAL